MPKAKLVSPWAIHTGDWPRLQCTIDFLLSVIIKPFTAKHIDLFVYFGYRRGAKHIDLCGGDIFYISWFLCYVMLCYIIMLLLQASLLAILPIPY